MSELLALLNLDKYKEDSFRKVKKAANGLSIALWELYSSFANSNGELLFLAWGNVKMEPGILPV